MFKILFGILFVCLFLSIFKKRDPVVKPPSRYETYYIGKDGTINMHKKIDIYT
jgi:hypothetical protein